MILYHVTVIGAHEGPVRIERLIESQEPALAAQRGLWLAETALVTVQSIMVKRKRMSADDDPGRLMRYKPENLRQAFYRHTCAPCATINARHLPEEERNKATRAVHGGDLPGLVGEGTLALHARIIDPLLIEDPLPILSTLIQIARDERMEWLVLNVEGPYLEDAEIYTE